MSFLFGEPVPCHEQSLCSGDELSDLKRLLQAHHLLSEVLHFAKPGVGKRQGCLELLGGCRLQEVSEPAGGGCAQEEFFLEVSGEEDDGTRRLFGDPVGGLDAVAVGHSYVHDDDVGLLFDGESDGLLAVGRLCDDFMAQGQELPLDGGCNGGLVFCQEYFERGHWCPSVFLIGNVRRKHAPVSL